MKTSQRMKVLKHLQLTGSITPVEALVVYKIPRLAARIEELRTQGYGIRTEIRHDLTGQKYAHYQYANHPRFNKRSS